MATTVTNINGDQHLTGDLYATNVRGNGQYLTSLPTPVVSGSANHVAIYDGSNVLAHEAILSTARGGTGVNTSASTGHPYVTNGVWTITTSTTELVDANTKIGRTGMGVVTTDDTVTTLVTVDMTPTGTNTKSCLNLHAQVSCGKCGEGASTNGETFDIIYKVTYNGTTMDVVRVWSTQSGTLPTYTVTHTTSSANFQLQVTGEAATTVNWGGQIQYTLSSFVGV